MFLCSECFFQYFDLRFLSLGMCAYPKEALVCQSLGVPGFNIRKSFLQSLKDQRILALGFLGPRPQFKKLRLIKSEINIFIMAVAMIIIMIITPARI